MTQLHEFSWFTAFTIFVTYIAIDVLYTAYFIHVEKRNAKTAATLSSAIYGLMAYGVVNYAQNIWYLIPLVLGAWIGTFITVKFYKKPNA